MTENAERSHGEAEVSEPQVAGANENALLKLLVELGPVAVFFLTNTFSGRLLGVADEQRIFWATGVFMVATAIALVTSRILFGKLPTMPLVSGALVLVLGGLTLWLQDDLFVKLKPTIVNIFFASALFIGLYFGKPILKYIFDASIRLTDEGWTILSFRWACFFLFLAVLNEVVWRTMSTDFWVGFKLFGVFPLTIAFALGQVGVLTRHQLDAGTDVTPTK